LWATKNRIVGVDKMQELSSLEEAFGAFYEAASIFQGRGKAACALSTSSGFVPRPALTKTAIIFDCGDMVVRIQRNVISDVDGKQVVDYLEFQDLGTTY
jgi:hypothetical protein